MSNIQLQIINAWEDIQKLQSEIQNRKDFIVTVNKKYFSLIKYENFINTILFVSAETPVNAYSDVGRERIHRIWVNYDIDFFNGSTELLHDLKAEIILTSQIGNVAFDTTNFVLPFNVSLSFGQPDAVQNQTVFTQFADDERHFRLSRSLYILDINKTSIVSGILPYLNPNGLPVLYSKLVIQMNNPAIFI